MVTSTTNWEFRAVNTRALGLYDHKIFKSLQGIFNLIQSAKGGQFGFTLVV
jgi:hypothetical protein